MFINLENLQILVYYDCLLYDLILIWRGGGYNSLCAMSVKFSLTRTSHAENRAIYDPQNNSVVVICTFSKMRLEYQRFLP
jgi:protein-tyrosine-phosphatase